MRRSAVCGVLLLALPGCTDGDGHRRQDARPPATTARASAAAKPAAVAGPARPVDAAAGLGPADEVLARALSAATLPAGALRPPQEAVVVVRRNSEGARAFGWISGDRYCLGHSLQNAMSLTCGPDTGSATVPVSRAGYEPATQIGRIQGFNDLLRSTNSRHQYYYSLAVIVDDAGPFRLTGAGHHRGVIHQAAARLVPDRTVTFVEWGYYGPEIPSEARVCNTSTHRCITDFD
ncbi:hypothetical protein [Streptomyces sp. ME109]|uniref:hypothetical protein n=1 Tax=Streptomyces sp. me109 TaxID=1827853 RepID=UPI001651673B|nr:hypothetical protein [Streptomyces sp. me109]